VLRIAKHPLHHVSDPEQFPPIVAAVTPHFISLDGMISKVTMLYPLKPYRVLACTVPNMFPRSNYIPSLNIPYTKAITLFRQAAGLWVVCYLSLIKTVCACIYLFYITLRENKYLPPVCIQPHWSTIGQLHFSSICESFQWSPFYLGATLSTKT